MVNFDDLPEDPGSQAQPGQAPALSFDQLPDDTDKSGTFGQKALTAVEGGLQGAIGPFATAGEEALSRLGVPGISAPERLARQEAYPFIHGGAEALTFGGSLFTGLGEIGALGKAGEALGVAGKVLEPLGLQAKLLSKIGGATETKVAQALTKGVASSQLQSIGARLAAGSARMGAEMALFQAGDEASKVINDVPSSPGRVASATGLGLALGGLGAGIGMAAKAAINSQVLRDFTDTMAHEASNVTTPEKIMQEFSDARELYHEMGSEVGGVDGIRAQAMRKLIPELDENMLNQASNISSKIQNTVEKLEKTGDKSGMVEQLRRQGDLIESAINPQIDPLTMKPKVQLDPADIYDTLNQVKRQLGEWAKYKKETVPLQEVAFRNSAKGLGYAIKNGLEDSSVWGEAGGLQKQLNAARSAAIDVVKDAEAKFMPKIGSERTISFDRFNAYLNKAGKATTQTERQELLGKFVNAMDDMHAATSKAYEAAGVENPFVAPSMTALKDSLNVQTVGSKLAKLWFHKLGPTGLSDIAGGGIGGILGHATGFPGGELMGAMLGKEVLSPAFASVIKPLMEKGANLPAFQASLNYVKTLMRGEAELTNAAGNVFGAGIKILPGNLYPNTESLNKLDYQIQDVAQNPTQIMDAQKHVGTYLPNHSMQMGKTAMTAANYLNTIRPNNPKMGALDKDIPVSEAQKAAFNRQLSIAEQPLTALQHVKDGTLMPQDVQTLKAIYPEYYQTMSQKLIGQMTEQVHQGKTIPYRIRQSLSLFLGGPVDSSMSAQSVQSAQAVFANKQAQQQQQAASQQVKKGTSRLGKMSENMLTADQGRQQRAMKG